MFVHLVDLNFIPANLPPPVIPAIVAYLASPLAGMSMIASLLNDGAICEKDAIVALIIGSTIALPLLYIRSFIPVWISIFGFRLGVLRGSIDLTLKILTRLLVLIIFF